MPGAKAASDPVPISADEIVGTSLAMHQVLATVNRFGSADDPVLIEGESGTGKELVAKALHRASRRANGPLVTFNCAIINDSLLESEMFGHEKGAFTSAVATKPGLFEVADGGTLFIDEIGEMAMSFQAKLLRVLEDYRVRRVGATRWQRINARVIAVTNKDLAAEVAARHFRSDLYYRISVLTIEIPPLRDRPEDIPHLVRYFLSLDHRGPQEIELAALQALVRYHWPGNVRELKNLIRRIKVLADGPTVTIRDIPSEILRPLGAKSVAGGASPLQSTAATLDDVERAHVLRALEAEQWNKSRAARVLGISRHRLYRLLEKYDLHD